MPHLSMGWGQVKTGERRLRRFCHHEIFERLDVATLHLVMPLVLMFS